MLKHLKPKLIVLSLIAACAQESREVRTAGQSCEMSDQCASNLCFEALCVSVAGDDDLDGLTNALELNTLNSDPKKADSDGDGLSDKLEVGEDVNRRKTRTEMESQTSTSSTADADQDCIPDQKDPQNNTPEPSLRKQWSPVAVTDAAQRSSSRPSSLSFARRSTAKK